MTTIERRNLGVTYYDEYLSAGGFTVFAPLTGNGRVVLINMHGDVEHEWNLPIRPGRDAVILNHGNLGYNGSNERSAHLFPALDFWHGGHFMEVTPGGDVVWEYEDMYHHHDAQWLPNGHILYAAAADVPVRKWDKQSDIVREVNRKGEIVWEWKAWEHLKQEDCPIHECFNDDHWPMINGLHQHGNLIYMSLRTTSGIIAVDKKTKNIKWMF